MFNVIFYDDIETKTTSSGKIISTRVPSRYVCTTMTSADGFFKDCQMQKFVGSFPALSSANYMFENAKIQYIKDIEIVENEEETGTREEEIPANFSSVTDGAFMFSDCLNLTDVNIDLRSLVAAEGIFSGCVELTSISGNMDSLQIADGMFSGCGKLTNFTLSMSNLESANAMFSNSGINNVYQFDSLENAFSMYKNCPNLGIVDITYPSLIDADMMFAYSSVTNITIKAPKLFNGEQMFYICPSLSSATCHFDSLDNGDEMFYDCDSLDNVYLRAPKMVSAKNMFTGSAMFRLFEGDLRGLKDGTEMFKSTSISVFLPTNLDSLEIGNSMFFGNNFTNWKIDMPKLVSGVAMFAGSIIPSMETGLTDFTADLSKLENGYQMFTTCNYLTNFNCALPSLKNGYEMFKGCKLSPQSIMYIVESLPTYTNTTATIDLGINATSATVDEFAQETGFYSSFNEITQRLRSKGWNPIWWDKNTTAIN